MEWQELLERDLIGCDLETQESGKVYRGPISKIEARGELLIIDTEWTAVLDFESSEKSWVKAEANPLEVDMAPGFVPKPQDIGQDRILLRIPLIGISVIFPKGRNLKKGAVKGL